MLFRSGVNNPLLVNNIRESFPETKIEILKHANAKEAMLFALLANETISGNKNTFGKGSKHAPNVSMGKICLPI